LRRDSASGISGFDNSRIDAADYRIDISIGITNDRFSLTQLRACRGPRRICGTAPWAARMLRL
jgi:hypothetical protein